MAEKIIDSVIPSLKMQCTGQESTFFVRDKQ